MTRKMKNSRLGWAGMIPKEWICNKAKFHVRINNGSDPKAEGDVPVYGSGNKSFRTCGEYKLGPAVLLGRKGSISNPRYIEGKFWNVDTAFDASVISNDLLPKYYYYLAQNFDYARYVTQTTLPSMTQTDYRNMKIPVPPVDEQQNIIAFIDKISTNIDATISLHQQIIEKLEEYRKSVITQAVTKGLNPNVEMAMTGNNRLPIIPKEWKLIRLPHIVDTRHPYALGDGDHGIIKTDMYKNHGIPYIRVQNLGWGTPLSIDNVVYISENDNMKIVNSTLQPNDVLFAKTGATIGKTAIVPETIPMSNTTSHVGKITVSPRYNPKYIFYVLSSEYGYHQMWIYASQKATRPELSLDDIKNFVLPIPKERQEQNNIVQYLDNVCEKILESIAQHKVIIEKLQEYKQSLIYNAVTGKIDCRTEGGEVQ